MKTLLIVNVQNDFCPGGAIACKDGDRIIPTINRLSASSKFNLIIATADWHPPNHNSFASQYKATPFEYCEKASREVWPDHCIAGTSGAAFRPSLNIENVAFIFHKGMKADSRDTSAFSTIKHIVPGSEEIYIVGMATDYCIWETAKEAIDEGYPVTVFSDAVAAHRAEDGLHTLSDLGAMGATITRSSSFLGIHAGEVGDAV